MKVIAMIPARYNASRFPGKLMQDLAGKPVIVRTFEAAVNTKLFDDVYIVTDSAIIEKEVRKITPNVIKSKKEHECGSDRIAEAVENIETDIVINIQGDEPFIDTFSLKKLIEAFKNDTKKEIDLASLKVLLSDQDEINNPNNVKVITDNNGFAIYFSRNPIPYHRNTAISVSYYKHIGVYAFRKEAILAFYTTPMTPLEDAEKIECIRYLEVGKKIKMIETTTQSIGIDTPDDLVKARKFITEHHE